MRMAKTYTKQERDERYERLPQVLKEALFSADIAEKMFELGKKHALTMEKIGFMSEEAGLVVLGLTPPRIFTTTLVERLAIPPDAAEKIALEISHEIFFPLREALKQAHQVEIGEGAMINKEARGTRQETRQGSQIQPMPEAVKTAPAAPVLQEKPVVSQAVPPLSSAVPKAVETKPAPQPSPPSSPLPTSEVKLPPMPAVMSKPLMTTSTPASGGNSEIAKSILQGKPTPDKTPEAPKAEPPRKPPATVRMITENLEKEIAPLVSTIRNGGPAGFLSREETEKLVIEKQTGQAGIMKQELRIKNSEKTPTAEMEPIVSVPPIPPYPPIPPATETKSVPPPSPAPPAPQQKNSIDLRGSAHAPMPPTPPPAIPTNPKIPPIDLRAAPPKEPLPPQDTPEKTRPYQGYDPYREPIE